MKYKLDDLYDWQQKQVNQLNSQWETFYNSNKHKNKIDWSDRQRGQAKAKIIFLVNQAINQKWKSLPTNKTIAIFANCEIRWVQKIINVFLKLRKWLDKIKNKVRLISLLPDRKRLDINQIMIKACFGYANPLNLVWEYFAIE